MESYYEINVAYRGLHFFATAPRSIKSKDKLDDVLGVIQAKFPESEGFKISVTRWDCVGHNIEIAYKED